MTETTSSIIIDSYVNTGKNLNEPNPDGYTATMIAACFGNEQILTNLLSQKTTINGIEYPAVNIDAVTRYGNSAAHLALRNKQYGTLKILIEHGADIDNSAWDGLCVRDNLDMLAKNDIHIVVPSQIQRITGLSAEEFQILTENNQTPIQLEIDRKIGKTNDAAQSARNKTDYILGVINANGKRKTNLDSDGWPYISQVILALSNTIENTPEYDKLRKIFLDCLERHNIDMPNRFGMTPLMIAVVLDNELIVDRLLGYNPNINATNIYRENVGHLAYHKLMFKKKMGIEKKEDFYILKTLLKHGIDATHHSFLGLCLNDPGVVENICFHGPILIRRSATQKYPTIQTAFDLPVLSRTILTESMPQLNPKEETQPKSLLFRWLFQPKIWNQRAPQKVRID